MAYITIDTDTAIRIAEIVVAGVFGFRARRMVRAIRRAANAVVRWVETGSQSDTGINGERERPKLWPGHLFAYAMAST
jgi:hypothetical protein